MIRKKTLVLAAVVCLGIGGGDVWGQGGPPFGDHDLTVPGVEIRPSVEVDIHLRVFINKAVPCLGRTLFAVHGLAHTAATWQPLAEQLFEPHRGPAVCRVVAVNLPGRGGSGVPDGVADGFFYGEMFLDDFVTVLLNTLDKLPSLGLRPSAVVAHSQGALLIQMAQHRLLGSGKTLRSEHGITKALFLAASPPADLPWFFADHLALPIFGPFITFDPVLGDVLAIPDAIWPFLFFTNTFGVPVSNFPTPEEVAAYNAIEPLSSSVQLVGAFEIPRPQVDPGIFASAKGTRLFMVANEEDVPIPPAENVILYEYLTGDTEQRRFAVAEGPEAVHDLYVSDPEALVEAMGALYRLFTRGR